jgi:hypothetical protein
MKYVITDESLSYDDLARTLTVEAESASNALTQYVEKFCLDEINDADEINVIIVDERGRTWEGTAEVEWTPEINVFVTPRKKKAAKSQT